MRDSDLSIFEIALKWLEEGKTLAVATVINTWGSSPCPAGSMLLVDSQGHFQGSVSGGCVESAVIATALDCITNSKTELMHFAVSNDQAWEVGLACGGEIDVFVEPIRAGEGVLNQLLLEQVVAGQNAQQSQVLVKNLTNADVTVYQNDINESEYKEVNAAIRQALGTDKCQLLEQQGQKIFIQPLNPALRMIIVGAVHIAQKLVSIAKSCGYQVTVIDPRQSFASEQRFPDVVLNTSWPDKAMEELKPDHRTAVITLTHDPKLDEPALEVALHSPAFYIGSLGSRRTHAGRIERLTERGLSQELLAKVHGPVGLDIQAQSTAEIAVAIMAEVTQTLRGI